MVAIPAARSFRHCCIRWPATRVTSEACAAACLHSSHLPQATYWSLPHWTGAPSCRCSASRCRRRALRSRKAEQDVRRLELGALTVAEQQRDPRGQGEVELVQLVGVGAELKQRPGLRLAGELGVTDDPAVIGTLDEVGVAEELSVEEGGLVDDFRFRCEDFGGLPHRSPTRSC